MDLINFLSKLVATDYLQASLVGVTVGTLIFHAIEWIDRQYPIPPTVKRVGAPALCLVIASSAYYGFARLTDVALTLNGWFLALCVAVSAISWITANLTHKTTEPAK